MTELQLAPILVVGRDAVENADTSQIMHSLKHLISSPDVASAYKEQIDISFHGYGHTHEEVFEIPQVRDFVYELDSQFPYWLFFLTKSGLGLQCLMHCFLLPYLTDEAKAEQHPKQLEKLLVKRWFPAMNAVSQFAGLDESDVKELTDRALRYFMDGPWFDD